MPAGPAKSPEHRSSTQAVTLPRPSTSRITRTGPVSLTSDLTELAWVRLDVGLESGDLIVGQQPFVVGVLARALRVHGVAGDPGDFAGPEIWSTSKVLTFCPRRSAHVGGIGRWLAGATTLWSSRPSTNAAMTESDPICRPPIVIAVADRRTWLRSPASPSA